MALSIPENAQTHYKCAFDIQGNLKPIDVNTYDLILETIKKWAEQKFNWRKYLPDWFFTGGSEQLSLKDKALIRTDREQGIFEEGFPEYWVCEIIHLDRASENRIWSIQMGIHRKESHLVFSLILKYWIREGFIGEIPAVPTSSSPGIIWEILDIPEIVCTNGGLPFLRKPFRVENHNVKELLTDLFSSSRKYPIIISAPKGPKSHIVNLEKLAKNIAGNSYVAELTSFPNLALLNKGIGTNLQCRPGTIRVFAPGVATGNPYEGLRHRFFDEDNHSKEDIVEMISAGISRNYRAFHPNQVYSLNHLVEIKNRILLQKRIESAKGSLDENIFDQLVEENSRIFAEKEGLAEKLYEEQVKLVDLNEAIHEHQRSKKDLEDTIASLQKDIGQSLKPDQLLIRFENLPRTSTEALQLILQLFPNRLGCTEQGLSTAESFSDQSKVIVSELWTALFHISTTLWDLLFRDNSNEFEQLFRSKSSFELAMTEGKMTKADDDLMKKRKDQYNGKTIDITPHVKYGNRPPRMFRIYFNINNDERKIIIGHLGDHIENYTSKKKF